ncbi:MAG TPA: phosphatidate cytidylyltransferase, partial [Actinomycetota bacterium]|nr:phosphatidate cytidylyltransferase [Actinomycetota bacterium]
MPNDKGDDELFEDLDKFFAPIRDVDWDEPEETATQAPQEAHVEVRADPADRAPEPTGELPVVEEPAGATEGSQEAWYDSGALAPIDELLGEPEPVDVEEDVVLVVDEDEDEDEDEGDADAGQHGLFEDDDELEEDVVAGPSEEDLEAAAAHFAGSLGSSETYPTEPVDVFGGQGSERDLLSDLGAPEEVEEALLSDLQDDSPSRTVVVGAEGFSGPSWQEPAAVEVGADLERRGPGPGERDVPAAFMTGVLLAGVALAALWLGSWAFAIVAGLAVLIAQGELFGVMVKHHHQPATLVGLVAGVLMMAGAYFKGEAATPAMFALGLMATFLWYMTVPIEHRTDVTRNIGLTVLNMAWIPLLGGYLIATLKLPDGRALVFWIILLTFLFDTSAFLIGSVSGGGWFPRPLAPNVSPKKSWEGLLGGTLLTVVASVALVTAFV